MTPSAEPRSAHAPATAACVVVDFGMGNLQAIRHKLQVAGIAVEVSADPERVAAAQILILPGVGHFAAAMKNLNQSGLRLALDECVLKRRVPIFGICLGMQLMLEHSEEGNVSGLCWIFGQTVRFRPKATARGLKVPHVGWNEVQPKSPTGIFAGITPGQRFYFTHSYHAVCQDANDVAATTEYGYEFPSAVQHENIVAVQFHPEKSHQKGMTILHRFFAQANVTS